LRMDAVGADQNVGRDPRAIVEPRFDMVASVGEADQAMAEMDALSRKSRRDDRQQIGAVNGNVRRAVKLFALWVERRTLQGAAIVPAPLMSAARTHAFVQQSLTQSKLQQDARRVRGHID